MSENTNIETPNQEPAPKRAQKIGKIIGAVAVPLALAAGTVYVVNKTKSATE